MPSRRHAPLALALLLCAAGCLGSGAPQRRDDAAAPPPDAGAGDAPTPPRASGTLGPNDLVEVRVFQEPEHSGTWRLSPEGTIDYPLCGKVALAGQSASAAADTLRACLADGYLRNPQVSVVIREYNSQKVFVIGEVVKPGTFTIDGPMSIVQAITLAGGFTKTAAKNNTHVTRVVDGQERRYRVPVDDIGQGRERNFQLQPGDIVFVPESFF